MELEKHVLQKYFDGKGSKVVSKKFRSEASFTSVLTLNHFEIVTSVGYNLGLLVTIKTAPPAPS